MDYGAAAAITQRIKSNKNIFKGNFSATHTYYCYFFSRFVLYVFASNVVAKQLSLRGVCRANNIGVVIKSTFHGFTFCEMTLLQRIQIKFLLHNKQVFVLFIQRQRIAQCSHIYSATEHLRYFSEKICVILFLEKKSLKKSILEKKREYFFLFEKSWKMSSAVARTKNDRSEYFFSQKKFEKLSKYFRNVFISIAPLLWQ